MRYITLKIIGIIIICGVILSYQPYSELRRFRKEIAELEKEIVMLKETNESLRSKLKALKEDPFYIEKVARDDLGLTKPGEIIYHIWVRDRYARGRS
jgi:cell division protein FtsB